MITSRVAWTACQCLVSLIGIVFAGPAQEVPPGEGVPFSADEAHVLVRQLANQREIVRQEKAFERLLEMGKAHPSEVLAALSPEDQDPVVAGYSKELWKLISYETEDLARPVYPVGNASCSFRRHLVCQIDLVGIDLSTDVRRRRVKELLTGREGINGVELDPAGGRALVRFRDLEGFDQVMVALTRMNDEGIGGEIRKQPEMLLGQGPLAEERDKFERYLEAQRKKGKESTGR